VVSCAVGVGVELLRSRRGSKESPEDPGPGADQTP
jgi:hypothetical protein